MPKGWVGGGADRGWRREGRDGRRARRKGQGGRREGKRRGREGGKARRRDGRERARGNGTKANENENEKETNWWVGVDKRCHTRRSDSIWMPCHRASCSPSGENHRINEFMMQDTGYRYSRVFSTVPFRGGAAVHHPCSDTAIWGWVQGSTRRLNLSLHISASENQESVLMEDNDRDGPGRYGYGAYVRRWRRYGDGTPGRASPWEGEPDSRDRARRDGTRQSVQEPRQERRVQHTRGAIPRARAMTRAMNRSGSIPCAKRAASARAASSTVTVCGHNRASNVGRWAIFSTLHSPASSPRQPPQPHGL